MFFEHTVCLKPKNIIYGWGYRTDAITPRGNHIKITEEGVYQCVNHGKMILWNSITTWGQDRQKNILLIELIIMGIIAKKIVGGQRRRNKIVILDKISI